LLIEREVPRCVCVQEGDREGTRSSTHRHFSFPLWDRQFMSGRLSYLTHKLATNRSDLDFLYPLRGHWNTFRTRSPPKIHLVYFTREVLLQQAQPGFYVCGSHGNVPMRNVGRGTAENHFPCVSNEAYKIAYVFSSVKELNGEWGKWMCVSLSLFNVRASQRSKIAYAKQKYPQCAMRSRKITHYFTVLWVVLTPYLRNA